MKKLIVMIVLAMLIVLLIPISTFAEGDCADSVKMKAGGNCEHYWFMATWRSTCTATSVSGVIGKLLPWPSHQTVVSYSLMIVFADGTRWKKTIVINKSNVCGPGIPPAKPPGSGGSSGPKPVSLPKRQSYLLFVDEQMYCYTIMKTPILGDAEDAWCRFGSPSEDINDFCLQSNYQDLFGCTLENYNVHYPSSKQLIHYYCG